MQGHSCDLRLDTTSVCAQLCQKRPCRFCIASCTPTHQPHLEYELEGLDPSRRKQEQLSASAFHETVK